jgi:hypothetical protein
MSRPIVRRFMLAAALGFAGLTVAVPVSAQTIYDANVESKLDLSPQQRAEVRSITQKSRADMMAVFKQFGIDPNAKPDFDKLMQASGPLQAIGRKERQAMSKILSPDQLKQYDKIVAETRTRVRMAAQKK